MKCSLGSNTQLHVLSEGIDSENTRIIYLTHWDFLKWENASGLIPYDFPLVVVLIRSTICFHL